MKIITVCLILIGMAAVQAKSVANPLASRGYISSRIVGGRDALENEFPYAVSVSFNWDWSWLPIHQCGGTILNEWWILTAAHCLLMTGGHYLVRAGALHLDQEMSGEQQSLVQLILIHNDFDSEAVVSTNDIGLMKLVTPLVFGESVQPMALPVEDSLPNIGLARISGWGSTTNNETNLMPNTLQTIELPVISNDDCQAEIDWSGSLVYPQDICTGHGDGDFGTCGGDSGSGLIQNGAVVGVVAWGFWPCGWSPTIYARVSAFVPWINSFINEQSYKRI